MYSKDEIESAEKYENLSPTYFRSNKIAESFYDQMEGEEFTDITKKCSEMFYDALNSNIVQWLVDDTSNNLSTVIQQTVEDEIQNILTGRDKLLKYIGASRAEYIRSVVFDKYADELKNDRIKDLERQIRILRGALY